MRQNRLKRYTVWLMGALGAMLVLWASFGSRGDATETVVALENEDVAPAESTPASSPEPKAVPEPEAKPEAPAQNAADAEVTPSRLLAMLLPSDTIRARNPYEAHFYAIPPEGIKMHINSVGDTLGRVFNNHNYLHNATAENIRSLPLRSLRDAWDGGSRLERISSCEAYYLDNLTHSLPYLVPQAHRLLKDIGMAFRDSLQARGGGDYRIKVTSVLRTPRLVSRLRRRNRNAVDTSAHLYGTTFDISYAKFICNSTRTPRTQEDMKNLLAEVVNDMRSRGRCYVKYERKQACFHITAR